RTWTARISRLTDPDPRIRGSATASDSFGEGRGWKQQAPDARDGDNQDDASHDVTPCNRCRNSYGLTFHVPASVTSVALINFVTTLPFTTSPVDTRTTTRESTVQSLNFATEPSTDCNVTTCGPGPPAGACNTKP